MKKTILLTIITLLAGLGVVAQPSQRQKMIHMAAVRMAGQMNLAGAEKETFISLYQEYKRESGEIMKIQPATSEDADNAAEQKILCDFEKSAKLLNLRKTYYHRFRQILSPTQIQKMYDAERSAISSGISKGK